MRRNHKYGDPPDEWNHSPLLSGCRGEGLLAIEMEVPCGGTGSRGSCEGSSECEGEGGSDLAGGGGSGTLSNISNGRHRRANLTSKERLSSSRKINGLVRSYRGLPEGLACGGPVGHAQNRTSQHDEV